MPNPPTPSETLDAARAALAYARRTEAMHATDANDITAALDLLARLTAVPDGEREGEIAERAARLAGKYPSTITEDLDYLLTQLRAARARVAEVEGERDRLNDLLANTESGRLAAALETVSRHRDEAHDRIAALEKDRDTLRRELDARREAESLTYLLGVSDQEHQRVTKDRDTLRRENEEMRLTLLNERGEGEPPSGDWFWTHNAWNARGERGGLVTRDNPTWDAGSLRWRPNTWTLAIRGMDDTTHPTARAAMRAATKALTPTDPRAAGEEKPDAP